MVASIWIVHAFDRVFSLELYRFGVLPRQMKGLWGILVSPFVHADLDHLMGNSAPILVLGWLLVYFYPKAAWRVVLACWAMGGLWVWTTARDNYHIGASGIIYGLAAFLFFSGLFRRRVALMAVSLIVVFLYGSMVWGVLPLQARVSWESHLFGAIAGALMAWFYRKVPPAHVPPPIVLEDEPDLDQALGSDQNQLLRFLTEHLGSAHTREGEGRPVDLGRSHEFVAARIAVNAVVRTERQERVLHALGQSDGSA